MLNHAHLPAIAQVVAVQALYASYLDGSSDASYADVEPGPIPATDGTLLFATYDFAARITQDGGSYVIVPCRS